MYTYTHIHIHTHQAQHTQKKIYMASIGNRTSDPLDVNHSILATSQHKQMKDFPEKWILNGCGGIRNVQRYLTLTLTLTQDTLKLIHSEGEVSP